MSRTQQLRDAIPEPPAESAANGAGQAVAKRPDPAGDLLASMEDEFRKCLPDVLPWDMFARIALTGFRKVPKLIECTRASLLGALMECARLGLAPCTEQATLSPFRNRRRNVMECQLVIGYQGYVQLMYRSGQVEQVNAELIYEEDEWDYTLGDGGRFFHRPRVDLPPEERGEPLLAYAYATLTAGGRTKVCFTPRWKAEALKAKQGNVWDSDFEAMWLKTPLRQVQKYAPKSSELRRALVADGATFDLGGIATPAIEDGNTVDGQVVEPDAGQPPAAGPAEDAEAWPATQQPPDGMGER